MRVLTATVLSVHAGRREDKTKPELRSIRVELDGIVGDKHQSFSRKAWAGDAPDGSSFSAALSQSPTMANTGTVAGLILGTSDLASEHTRLSALGVEFVSVPTTARDGYAQIAVCLLVFSAV